MDFAYLSDAEIERLATHGRTPEEESTARRILRRRRARDRKRVAWSPARQAHTEGMRPSAAAGRARQRWTEAGEIRPSRFDRRALQALCVKEGWADMPPEDHGDLALFVWCVARGLYDRPGIRQLL